MKSRTTKQFRKAFANLPKQVQKQAREAYWKFTRILDIPVCTLSKRIRDYQFTQFESAWVIGQWANKMKTP